MPELESLEMDAAALGDGVWIEPGPEWGDLLLKVSAFTDAYQDELAREQSAMVRRARMEGRLRPTEGFDALPQSERGALSARILLARVLHDVRNLSAGGQPVTVEQYRQVAAEPRGRKLLNAVYAAAEIATTRSAASREDAAGNSPAAFGIV
jgi:hypothetical protein